jgi:hypothetical protein
MTIRATQHFSCTLSETVELFRPSAIEGTNSTIQNSCQVVTVEVTENLPVQLTVLTLHYFRLFAIALYAFSSSYFASHSGKFSRSK